MEYWAEFLLLRVLLADKEYKSRVRCDFEHVLFRLAKPAKIKPPKIILRCVGFCLYILHFICEAAYIANDPTYTCRIIVPVAFLNIL